MVVKKLHVYVVHASNLYERRKVIDELRKNLGKYNFTNVKVGDIDVITSHDAASIPGEFIQKNVDYSQLKTEGEMTPIFNSLIRILHINNISNALKHHEALSKIAKGSEDDIHMVIEDDVLFEQRMCMLLDRAIGKFSSSHGVLFLGMPNNEEVTNPNVINVKECKQVFKVLPYNDSYFIRPATAKQLVEKFFPLKFYTNIHMSYLMEMANITMYQTVPNIFIDGSKYGMYLSTLMVNNDLVFNRDYMFLKSLIGKEPSTITLDEKKTADKLITESQIANNPDFLTVVGKYIRHVKNDSKKTRDIYQKAYDAYLKNGCVINNESIFLRDYINLHVHLQPDI